MTTTHLFFDPIHTRRIVGSDFLGLCILRVDEQKYILVPFDFFKIKIK